MLIRLINLIFDIFNLKNSRAGPSPGFFCVNSGPVKAGLKNVGPKSGVSHRGPGQSGHFFARRQTIAGTLRCYFRVFSFLRKYES